MAKVSKRKQTRRGNSASTVNWPLWGGVAAVVAFVVLVGYAVYANIASSGGIEGVQLLGNQARGHEVGVLSYPNTPPAGGIHNAAWQNCGIYDQPVANENAVHSLEHGAVWITYQADLAADEVEQLRDLVRGRRYTLLSPYNGALPAPVVISAWGVQLAVDEAGDNRLPRFISEYAQGPQTPEPGAACTGGIGEPTG